MEKDREEKARRIVEEIETYQEAYGCLISEGYDSIETEWILKDFLEIR